MKRAALYLAMAPIVVGPAVAAFADTVSTPAPPSSSEATAVGVAGVVAVGHTTATAGSSSGGASANAVELGGKPPADQFGGTASQGQTKHGALLDTDQTPLGRLMLTPWNASASGDGHTAHGDAALAHANVVDEKTLSVTVLGSRSDAVYAADGSSSSSTSSSDGADVNAGDGQLHVVVLHSESASGQGGGSYLLGLNGNQVGSSDQVNGQCAIDASPLLALQCLTASGGKGSTTASAAGANVTLAGGQLPSGVVTGVTAKGTPATAPANTPAATSVSNDRQTNASPTRSATTGGLPFTGINASLLGGYAAALLALGAAILRAARRRATD